MYKTLKLQGRENKAPVFKLFVCVVFGLIFGISFLSTEDLIEHTESFFWPPFFFGGGGEAD